MRFRIRDSFFENFCTVILLFLSFPEEKGGDETSNVLNFSFEFLQLEIKTRIN